ncbi:MAG: hypothetical protein ACFFC7_26075 [Candidatus Hermodarchaeota archaeon]
MKKEQTTMQRGTPPPASLVAVPFIPNTSNLKIIRKSGIVETSILAISSLFSISQTDLLTSMLDLCVHLFYECCNLFSYRT